MKYCMHCIAFIDDEKLTSPMHWLHLYNQPESQNNVSKHSNNSQMIQVSRQESIVESFLLVV